MNARTMVRGILATTLLCAIGGQQTSQAATLINDAFSSGHTGWVDAFPVPTRLPNWRINLHVPTTTLMDTNNANPPTSGGISNGGNYQPDVLVKPAVTAPGTYDLTATMRTNDDDIIGLVWNYLDAENYFRVGIRQQTASGTFGGTQGLAVQKVVGGVITQLFPTTNIAGPAPITQAMINARTPFDLKVSVSGTSYNVFFNGVSQLTGGLAKTDADLVSGRSIGVQSWAQQADTTTITPFWGSEIETITLSDAGGTLYTESFTSTPTKWRNLKMTNSLGISTPYLVPVSASTTSTTEDVGNFGQDVNDPWIWQESNGFSNSTGVTESTANIDFIGPAVVIDEPGSSAYSDYAMRVRMGARDNDGYGVLVRVQDDNNYYRINFANQAIGTGRSPQGMSVQKVVGGVWTELFREDQNVGMQKYLPAVGAVNSLPGGTLPMFDVIVQALGNKLSIRVIDEFGNLHVYDPIVDSSSPLLTGTVGLTTWGTTNVFFMRSNYHEQDQPFLSSIPEPSSVALALVAGLGLIGMARRRK